MRRSAGDGNAGTQGRSTTAVRAGKLAVGNGQSVQHHGAGCDVQHAAGGVAVNGHIGGAVVVQVAVDRQILGDAQLAGGQRNAHARVECDRVAGPRINDGLA